MASAIAARVEARPKLLLVDDLPANLIALEAVLGTENYELLTAGSGQEAIDLLETTDVSVVLLDVQMPEMDGFETARRIKSIPHCRDTPIIFVTAIHKEDPFIKRGYDAGAIDYFSKPFDPDILRLKVGIYSAFKRKEALLKEREQRVEESEELLRAGRKLSAVLESLPVGVVIADADGRIGQTNDEMLRIWHSVDPGQKDSYGEIMNWWNREGQAIKGEQGPLERALHSGQATHNEKLEITCVDGSRKTILSSASPLQRLDGVTVGAVLVVQDVTEHKRFQHDLETKIMGLLSAEVELEHAISHG